MGSDALRERMRNSVQVQQTPPQQKGTELSDKERAWIRDHPALRVVVHARPPYAYTESGIVKGYSIDVLRAVAGRLGLPIANIAVVPLAEAIERLKAGTADIATDLVPSGDRDDSLIFTEPYYQNPDVIVARDGSRFPDLASLDLKFVASLDGSVYEFLLHSKGISPAFTPCPSFDECLHRVATGHSDATIAPLSVANYIITHDGLTNLRIVGEAEGFPPDRSFATGKGNTILRDMFDRALADMDAGEKEGITRKWFGVAMADSPLTTQSAESPLPLSYTERAWVKAHPVIRASNENDWPPYDFAVGGQAQGFSIDLLNLLVKRAGLTVQYVNGVPWNDLVTMFNDGKIDLLHSLIMTPERSENGLFSEAYLRDRSVFIVRKGDPDISDMGQLRGKTVAVGKGWSDEEFFSKNYPDIARVAFDNIAEKLDAVSSGRVDASIEVEGVARYWFRKKGLTDLRISGWAREIDGGGNSSNLYFYAHKDAPELIAILNKALASTPLGDLQALQQKWFGEQEASTSSQIDLTSAERAWIRAHPVIRVSNETDWPPFDFAIDGKPQGFTIDLLNALARRIGIEVQYVTGPPWDQLMQMYSDGKIDLLHSLYNTPERAEHGLFSDPTLRVRSMFVTRRGDPDITDASQLEGKTVAVGKGWSEDEYIARNYPGIKRVTVNSTAEKLDAVSSGRADATVDIEGAVLYWMRKNGLTDLKVAGWAKQLDEGKSGNLHFYAHKDAPELISVLNKAMAAMPQDELQALQQKWFGQADAAADKDRVPLTEAERAYLARKGVIKMCVQPDWMPFGRIDDQGKFVGIAAELSERMSERLGFPFSLVATRNWEESVAGIRSHRCDILPLASDLPNRRDAMNFTKPYVVQPFVIVTRSNELFVKDLSDLGDRPVGLSKEYGFAATLSKRHPNLKLVPVADALDGLKKVRSGELWAYLDALPIIGYTLQKQSMFDLKVAGKAEFDLELSLASRNDEPELASIMQKATDSISEDDRRAIVSKWLSIRYEQGVDWGLMWRVILLALGAVMVGAGIVVVVFVNNRKLAKLNREVTTAREAMAALLDNSGQGFLSFGADLVIRDQFSRACVELLGRAPAGSAVDALLTSGDQAARALYRDCVAKALAANTPFQRDTYLSLLPKEIAIGGKSIEVEYFAIEGGVMAVLSDVSRERAMAQRATRERHRMEMIVAAVTDRDDFFAAVEDFRQFAQKGAASWRGHPAVDLHRAVHTYKGTFGQFSFHHLPAKLHEMENELRVLADGDEAARLVFTVDWNAVLEYDLRTVTETLGEDFVVKGGIVTLDPARAAALERFARRCLEDDSLAGDDRRLLADFASIRHVSLKRALAEYDRLILQVSARLEKEVLPLEVGGDDVRVDPDVWGPFLRSLGHVFRNAVDHGIEDPDTRLEAGKFEAGRIRCLVTSTNGRLVIEIADDGAGIDEEHLRARAQAMNLAGTGDLPLAELIFVDGLSRRDRATELSGRGVGLAAVRVAAAKLNGTVIVSTDVGRGTIFVFDFPFIDLA